MVRKSFSVEDNPSSHHEFATFPNVKTNELPASPNIKGSSKVLSGRPASEFTKNLIPDSDTNTALVGGAQSPSGLQSK